MQFDQKLKRKTPNRITNSFNTFVTSHELNYRAKNRVFRIRVDIEGEALAL